MSETNTTRRWERSVAAIQETDPTGWETERLRQHAAEFCSLPLRRPGPIPSPLGHPENPEPEDDAAPLGEVLGVVGAGVCFAALGFALVFGFAVSFIGEILK